MTGRSGLLLLFVLSQLAAAESFFNPALVQGIGSTLVNPAFRGSPNGPGFGYRILDIEAGFGNNSFRLSQYNRYSGAYLDAAAKEEILSSVPGSGFRVAAEARATVVEFGQAGFSAWLRSEFRARAMVPHELIELALEGNTLARQYRITTAEAYGYAFTRAGVGLATALGRNLAAGVSFNYLYGLGCFELTSMNLGLLTTVTEVSADGRVRYRTATGGNGWGVDAGLVGWHRGWRLGLACLDIGSGIRWQQDVKEVEHAFELEPGNAYQVRTEQLFDYVHAAGTAAPFVTRLPLRFNLTLGRSVTDRLNAGMITRLRFMPLDGASDGWDTRAVVELLPLKWLPMSCQVGYGSEYGFGLDAALGIILGRLIVAPRISYRSGMLLNARGMDLGLSVSYENRRRQPSTEVFRIHHDMN